MQLNPSEISDLIKAKIQNLAVAAEARTEGTVVSVSDGIVRVHGLADVMQGEMLEFPGNTFGLALNLRARSMNLPSASPSMLLIFIPCFRSWFGGRCAFSSARRQPRGRRVSPGRSMA